MNAQRLIDLSGTWTLRDATRKGGAIPASVPGDNYSALEAAGLLPDPYAGSNEWLAQWPAGRDWVFARTFEVPGELLAEPSVLLEFDSIDTVADIVLNGRRVGRVANEFRRWRFEVRDFLRRGPNELEVRIRSHVRAIGEDIAAHPHADVVSWGCNTLHQIERLRKSQCSSGWDWGVSLPTCGLYGGVRLFGAETATLEYLWDDQRLSRRSAEVALTAELLPTAAAKAGDEVEVCLRFDGQSKTVVAAVPRDCGPFRARASFQVGDPGLWWPNGLGGQRLYEASATAGGRTIRRSVGLRTVEVVRERDGDGETFGFRVNGRDIFAKGANWIPCEAHPGRRTEARRAHLLESMAAANMNMVRVWGGGVYEPDSFYEACDRLGLLVWQDMMFACGVYPDWREFTDNVRAEVAHQVKRLRSHPSIALWCGDNENLSCVYVTRSHYALVDRLIRTEGDVVAQCDPSRPFWPTSPCSGDREYERNFDPGRGDTHLWGVDRGDRDLGGYLSARARFVSEFGFASFPSMETVRSFAEGEADLNIASRTMENHVKKDGAVAGILAMVSNYFRMPEDFGSTIYLSQVKQAYALSAVVGKWRTLMPYCRGALYWQLNDWWPVTSWSTIEHSGRWKPAHYAARRFFAPLAAVVDEAGGGGRRAVRVVWDLPRGLSGELRVSIRAIADGREAASWTRRVVFRKAGVQAPPLPDFCADTPRAARLRGGLGPRECFLHIALSGTDDAGGRHVYEDAAFLEAFKRYDLPDARLAVTAVTALPDGAFGVEVSAAAPAFFVWLSVAGDPLGRFDDNLVAMLPGRRTFRYAPGARLTAAGLRRRLETPRSLS